MWSLRASNTNNKNGRYYTSNYKNTKVFTEKKVSRDIRRNPFADIKNRSWCTCIENSRIKSFWIGFSQFIGNRWRLDSIARAYRGIIHIYSCETWLLIRFKIISNLAYTLIAWRAIKTQRAQCYENRCQKCENNKDKWKIW